MVNVMRIQVLAACVVAAVASSCSHTSGSLQPLHVSENGHYIQNEDGSPFFYLGDTAWELFHRLDREEADSYLEDRAEKGFNVIQAVALSEIDGVDVPNAYGYLPLEDRNPAKPSVAEGPDNDYWDHVDYIVQKANSLGMHVGLLPTWGRWWNDDEPIFDESNAEEYGRWIAERYKDSYVIWILGGDRNPDEPYKLAVVRAMARGIRSVDKKSLVTYHPKGWETSSKWFHGDDWLDFNSRQSGHNQRYESNRRVMDDFFRAPAKPILEIEPLYEDHPLEFAPDNDGHSNAWDVRRAMYWSVFYGSAGVTYGHHSLWQMYDPEKGRAPINRPLMPWRRSMDQPGARQAVHIRRLMESRPYLTRIPSPEFIVQDEVRSSVPGAGRYHFAATMDSEGSYAMVYAPLGRAFSVNAFMIKADMITAWWYCPRTGEARKAGKFENDCPVRMFEPPVPGEPLDWVLVLDDASKDYPAPGRGMNL